MKRGNNNRKKASKNKKLLEAFILFIIAIVGAYFGYDILSPDKFDQDEQFEPNEIVEYIGDSLYIPTQTALDIGLVEETPFEGVTISWESSNPSVMTSEGKIQGIGSAELSATISLGEVSKKYTYNIQTLEQMPYIESVNESFEDSDGGTYASDWTYSNFNFHQSIVAGDSSDKFIRMRANEDAYIVMNYNLNSVKTLTFDYQIYSTDSTKLNKPTYINVYYSQDDGVNWISLSQKQVTDADLNNVEIDLTSLSGDVRLKIEATSEYETDLRIDFDNLKIIRNVTSEDIISWIDSYVPNKAKTSIILPKTTKYGGVINWSSNNTSLINYLGLVNRPTDSSNVTLTATITGFASEITHNIELVITGSTTVTPLEVYFIDLGKYDDADTGESIYIKLGEIDILVDAGDDMNATKQAITEIIDENSEDKVLDYIIATHPDADHIGSMAHIFETYQVLNLLYFYGTHTTNLYQEFVQSVNNEGLVSECVVTDAYNNANGCKRDIELDEDVYIKVVDTGHYTTSETNGRSIVFVLEAYGTRMLLTGDADNGSGRDLESYYMDEVGDIDILKAVHHGTKEGTTLDFLEETSPEVVIITNGNYFGNKHGHPTADAINRIYQNNDQTKIYAVVGGDDTTCDATSSGSYECSPTDRFIDRNGTIKVVIDNNGYDISAEYSQVPIELSSTIFWQTHPDRRYSYNR